MSEPSVCDTSKQAGQPLVPQAGRMRAPHDGRLAERRVQRGDVGRAVVPSGGEYLLVVLDRGEGIVEVVQQLAPALVLDRSTEALGVVA